MPNLWIQFILKKLTPFQTKNTIFALAKNVKSRCNIAFSNKLCYTNLGPKRIHISIQTSKINTKLGTKMYSNPN